MKKRKICIFCEKWESGGIESFLHNVLTHVNISELEVDIVASQLSDSIFTSSLEAIGVRFFELSGSQKQLFKNHSLFMKHLKRSKYDVVHLNVFQGLSLYYALLAKRAGIPVRIAHSHNTALRKSITRPLKLLLHKVARGLFSGYATDLWACSGAAANFLFASRTLAQKGYRFIPNGIDTNRFRFVGDQRDAVRSQMGLTNDFVIGNVGRLCYQKNQSFLLDVFSDVLKLRPNSRLLLVGEGENRTILQDKANELGVSERVIFYGVSDHVEQLFWAMDVFAFPSHFEGLGIVALEAQAAGLPVLCSEYIPQEAMVSSLAHTIALREGTQSWAEQLINMSVENRIYASDQVSAAGFDIEDVAEQIKVFYLGQDKV